ncbi:MAG: hypothetical protein PHZ02_09920 [Desulfocapsaceae bacterium]|nr:hypothetical protein [Desulfocapsaceae bacterium]
MTAHEKATSFELAGRPEVALSQQKHYSIIHKQKQQDKLFYMDWGPGRENCEKTQGGWP